MDSGGRSKILRHLRLLGHAAPEAGGKLDDLADIGQACGTRSVNFTSTWRFLVVVRTVRALGLLSSRQSADQSLLGKLLAMRSRAATGHLDGAA